MRLYYKLTITFLLYIFFTPLLFSQSIKSVPAGEIAFNDTVLFKEYNKVYLLQPGEYAVIKNLCTSEEIAIGSKKYFDISNKMALAYQDRDSLTIKIISEYQKLNLAINNLEFNLKMIRDNLRSADLQPSIELLDKSNIILKHSNRKLDNAVTKLNEINSDLTGFQFANLWRILAAGLAGFIAGALIF
jgi:hypothetical protein